MRQLDKEKRMAGKPEFWLATRLPLESFSFFCRSGWPYDIQINFRVNSAAE